MQLTALSDHVPSACRSHWPIPKPSAIYDGEQTVPGERAREARQLVPRYHPGPLQMLCADPVTALSGFPRPGPRRRDV